MKQNLNFVIRHQCITVYKDNTLLNSLVSTWNSISFACIRADTKREWERERETQSEKGRFGQVNNKDKTMKSPLKKMMRKTERIWKCRYPGKNAFYAAQMCRLVSFLRWTIFIYHSKQYHLSIHRKTNYRFLLYVLCISSSSPPRTASCLHSIII